MKKTIRTQRNLLRNRLRMSQIELLAAMERSPTLSAAARDVNLTQPAGSRLLNTLATDLGIPLFELEGRSLKATAAGHALVDGRIHQNTGGILKKQLRFFSRKSRRMRRSTS